MSPSAKKPAHLAVAPSRNEKIKIFEDILDLVGTNGWKNYVIFFMAAASGLILALPVFAYQFMGATPEYRCEIPVLERLNWTNEQVKQIAIPYHIVGDEKRYSGCTMFNMDFEAMLNSSFFDVAAGMATYDMNSLQIMECPNRVFQGQIETVVTKWDLVCERRPLYASTQAAVMAGMLLGSLVFGYIIDKFGRARIYKYASVFYLLSGLITPFSLSVGMFIAFKIFSTFVSMGTYMSGFVLVMEMSSLKQRAVVGSYYVIPWALGIILSAAICWMVRPWKLLQVYLTLPGIVLLLSFWLLPESPRWLILNGRYEEAMNILENIAEANKKKIPSKEMMIEGMMNIKQINSKDCGLSEKKTSLVGKFVGILKTLSILYVETSLRKRSTAMTFIWFAVGMVYFGISLGQSSLNTDPYLYILIGGVLELIGYLLLWPLVLLMGRKKTIVVTFFISAFTIFIVMFVVIYANKEELIWLKTILFLMGKFFITPTFHLLWIFTAELYATNVRSLAIGEFSTFARVGSICSPYINDILGAALSWAPAALFGITSLLAGICVLALQETSSSALPDSLHSQHLQGEKKSEFNIENENIALTTLEEQNVAQNQR